MDFNRGDQLFSWLPSSNSLLAISFHCHIQSFLFMIDALCLITDILGPCSENPLLGTVGQGPFDVGKRLYIAGG